nr:hypothetical protein [Brevibacillus laterosporus]
MNNSICPICNGFQQLLVRCPNCRSYFQDKGKLSDYQGDYSPYLSIDDSKKSNGYADLLPHLCLHICSCTECGCSKIVPVQEQSATSFQID